MLRWLPEVPIIMQTTVDKWLRVSRFNFLPVSLLPYAAGAALALRSNPFNFPRFACGLIGAAIVHLAANLLNEYWDDRLGADRVGSDYSPHFGGSKTISEDLLSAFQVRRAARLLLGLSLLLAGILSLILKSSVIIFLVTGGALIAWAYTARPFSLIYRGWGEIALLIAFGPLLVTGGYYLQTLTLSFTPLLFSFSPGSVVLGVLIANELADAGSDAPAGKKNWAVRWGEKKSLIAVAVCFTAAYLIPVAGTVAGIFPSSLLLVLLTLPFAGAAFTSLRRAANGHGLYLTSSRRTIIFFNLFHGGLILGAVLA